MYTTQGSMTAKNTPSLPSIHASRPPQQSLRDDEPAILPPIRNLDYHSQHRRYSSVSVEIERTRQEMLKLERYKVKRDMLRELLRAGVPPSQIPLFFTDRPPSVDWRDSLPQPRAQSYSSSQPSLSPTTKTWTQSPSSPVSVHSPGAQPAAHTSGPWQARSFQQSQSSLAALIVDPSCRRPEAPSQPFNTRPTSSDLAQATNNPAFSTDVFSTSPRALQFKFYKPGPKPKVLRRRKQNVSPPQNGVSKHRPRKHDRTNSDVTSASSPTATGLLSPASSPHVDSARNPRDEHRDEVSMSDVEDESEDDDEGDDSGSELG